MKDIERYSGLIFIILVIVCTVALVQFIAIESGKVDYIKAAEILVNGGRL